jgi:hypothetical protein
MYQPCDDDAFGSLKTARPSLFIIRSTNALQERLIISAAPTDREQVEGLFSSANMVSKQPFTSLTVVRVSKRQYLAISKLAGSRQYCIYFVYLECVRMSSACQPNCRSWRSSGRRGGSLHRPLAIDMRGEQSSNQASTVQTPCLALTKSM